MISRRFGKKSKKTRAPPSRPHQGTMPSHMDSRGHIMTSEERKERWRKAGLCMTCGQTQTHRHFLGMKQPLTIDKQVYKGKCLRCMSLTQAQLSLNEPCVGDHLMNRNSVDLVHDVQGGQQPRHGSGGRQTPPLPGIPESAGRSRSPSSGSGQPASNVGGLRAVGSTNSGADDGGTRRGHGREQPQYHPQQGRNGSMPPSHPNSHTPSHGVVTGPTGGDYHDAHYAAVNDPISGLVVGDDDMTVASEITMDPGIMTHQPNQQREASLEKITEDEESNNNLSRSQGTQQQDIDEQFNSSFDNKSHGNRSNSGSHSRARSIGSGSGTQPGARTESVAESSNFENLLQRKMNQEQNERTRRPSQDSSHTRSHSDVHQTPVPMGQRGHVLANTHGNADQTLSRTLSNGDSTERSDSGSGIGMQPGARTESVAESRNFQNLLQRKMNQEQNERIRRPSQDPNERINRPSGHDAGHVHFNDMTAQRTQAARGDYPESHFQEAARSDNNSSHTRSHSDVHQPPVPIGQRGHVRANTHGNANQTLSRTLSNGDSTERSDSDHRSASKPGVQQVSGDYICILDRKIRKEDPQSKEKLSSKSKETLITPGVKANSMSGSEARSLIAECSTCVDLIDALKKNVSWSQQVLLLALSKLNECLVSCHGTGAGAESFHHRSMPMDSTEFQGRPSKIAFPNGGWAKVLASVMSSNSSEPVVQAELLHTMWSIVTMNPRYTSDLTSNADMKEVISTMETNIKDECIQEYGCGLIACIAASQKHAQRLVNLYEGKFIERLMGALYFLGGKGNVQENALKGLLRLSSASLSSDIPKEYSVVAKMGSYAQEDLKLADDTVNAITAILNTMKRYLANISVQILGNRLLWNMFHPSAIQDADNVVILIGKCLQHIETAMVFHQESQPFYETIICLLSKMSYFVVEEGEETLLLAAVKTMKKCPSSGVVALHACRCLVNICSRSPHSLLLKSVQDGIPGIISFMDTFQDNINVQSEACTALSAIARKSPPNKKRVQALGGIGRINRAYDCYSVNPYDDDAKKEGYDDNCNCMAAKTRAIVALTTLAVDPEVLTEIQDKGLITKFERLIEEDHNMPGVLQSSIQRLLTLASDSQNQNQDRYLTFQEGANEDFTGEYLRANIRLLTKPDFDQSSVPSLRTNAIKVMGKFPMATYIHELACKLLACIFALLSKEDGESQDDTIAVELDVITTSLEDLKNSPTNAAAACSALQNFCSMLSLSDSDVPSLDNLLPKSVTEVINALIIHQDDEEIFDQSVGALFALCATREGLALSLESNTTIGLIIGTMERYSTSKSVQRHCIGVLGVYFSVSNRMMEYLNDELVIAIVNFMEKEVDNDESDDLIVTAMSTILVMTNKGYQAVTVLLRHEKVIDTVVSCMWKFPNNLSIQSAGTTILSNVALDNYLRADVCQRGGTSRIISALDRLKHDSTFVCKAFTALANLTSGADIEILRAVDAPAPSIFVGALTAHPDNLSVQVSGAHALWALSARSDSFKDEIVNLGGAEAIAEAMETFVGCKQMQAKGFVVAWSLAVPRHLKTRVGQCTIEPLVDGMSAHFASEKICEEALGCIKAISTIPVNKDLLEENGAVDLIYSCLWLHLGNSSVCKAALAALCNISVNVESNEVSDIKSEDLDAVINTMRHHQRDKAVQESAIILLRNFTFSYSNVRVLEQNPFIVALIRSAMSNHNDNFQGRADDLLRVLPSLTQ